MKYKYKRGGVVKLQNAGSLPKWMQKLNAWANKNISESDESVGERILNSTIKEANNASTQEERDKIYKDSAKNNLAVTGQSLMILPMLGEFTTYGLLGGGLRLGTGLTGSKAGEYVLGKAGDWADKKLNTKFLGTTGRILGGLGGWWGGSSATTPLFRNLAGKGITLHMPQETFMNLRGQYFTNAASKARVNSKPNPILNSTIEHLYKEYPELSSIGPKEAYRQYYETIFPASKVQTPYAHGTKSNLSGGLETSVKIPNAAAPETIGRNDFYLNLQPEASLQYADGIGVPKGFTWNKHRFWPLKEILGKPYKSDAWMSKPIKLREQVPNRAGQFSRVKNADGTYSGHGKLLEEYKAELGMQDLSNEEFLQRLGVQNEESFNQWVAKNRQMFSDIYNSGDYHGLYHVKIDANKPLTINGGDTYYSERGIWDRMNKGGNDVLLHNNAANEFGSDVAVVRDVTPQKVRILGSKPDQQGFADFIGGRQQFLTEIPTSPGNWVKQRLQYQSPTTTVWTETPKRAFDSTDRFIAGRNLVESLKRGNLPTIDAHGISKGNELEYLESILQHGIDAKRGFSTAPLFITKGQEELRPLLGAALGTSSGTAYNDGLFILTSKPNSLLKNGIDAILINDADPGYARFLKQALHKKYPNFKFVTYGDAPDYYGVKKYTLSETKTPMTKFTNNKVSSFNAIDSEFLPPLPEEINISF